MNFYKKILVVKQKNSGYSINGEETSGIVRVEHEDGETNLSLSLINFKSIIGAEYYCAVLFQNNKIEYFSLGKKPSCHVKTFSSHLPFQTFSVGIFIVKEGCCVNEGSLVAYASEEGEIVKERLINDFFLAIEKERNANKIEEYNDEAVATENYYSIDEDIEKKVKLIDGWDKNANGDENFNEYNECQEKEEEGKFECDCVQNEENVKEGECYSREHPYYLVAKAELDELFLKFPKDNSLSKIFPNGTFCKIYYSEDKYYTVGTVLEEGEVKYICYGVPGKYSTEPPKNLKEYCSFVPLSIFDLQGEGFWMMFQDAVTGMRVKKEDKS